MVDFKKHLGHKTVQKSLDPIEIYKTLDRASDKGELRTLQKVVLSKWHSERRAHRDVILKVHTGQGKTLLGLLMLQSKLNEGKGPALYLCPNHFLVNQTMEQARQFGIRCITTEDELPAEFLEGKAILVAVVHKLFNGKTKFELRAKAVSVGTILLDDAHACMDTIQSQCMIRLGRTNGNEANAYNEIRSLFEDSLREQGEGTFEDISKQDFNAYLPVPYWAWWERSSEVAAILARHAEIKAVVFAWPLLKDQLKHTFCLISGTEMVIAPYLPPLDAFGSYANAGHRIYMSATVTDDSFLVKGFGLPPKVIQDPLVDPDESWSGEKMVLMPSLIHEDLTRERMVEHFGPVDPARKYGVVGLVPSAARCADWRQYKARVADSKTIEQAVGDLRNRDYARTLVVANYYDGIDLPDDTCRVLVIDSKPFAEELLERYIEDRRHGSQLLAGRNARIIEQGMGRAVRGEKDYCVIVLIGNDLLRTLQAPEKREFFSDQTRTQIEIGRSIVDFSKSELEQGKPPLDVFRDLVGQCLGRDENWKAFYADRMNEMSKKGVRARPDLLEMFQAEVAAEKLFQDGHDDTAIAKIRKLLETAKLEASDRGWYEQEIARYTYASSKAGADEIQKKAHSINRSLLRPKRDMLFAKVETPTPERRLEQIKEWLAGHQDYENVALAVGEIMTNFSFGVAADKFEAATKNLATALGFASDRPDKEWKAGPDNLWGLRDNDYLLLEAKNEVALDRSEIVKTESDQMNRSSAWFQRYYPGSSVTRILIHPTKKLAKAAAFTDETFIMRKKELDKLKRNVTAFFNEFRGSDLRDLSTSRIHELIQIHKLSADDIKEMYAEKPVALGSPS